MPSDEELHRHAIENLKRADALLFGRVIYEMMEEAWRPVARTGVRPDWMEFSSGAVAMRYEPKTQPLANSASH